MTTRTTFVGCITALAIAASGLAAGAAAAREGHRAVPAFSELDVDGNGSINRADLTAFAAARFAASDTDGNGSLSAAELKAAAEARASARAERMGTMIINRMDADGDGELSQAEMQSVGKGRRGGGDMGERMLKRADTDGDGAVSEAEYDAARQKMAAGGDNKRGKKRGARRGN